MASITDLQDFGDTDAEVGFRPEYFVANTTWQTLRRGDRPIVIGRKGTGKTALRVGLRSEAERDPTLFVRELSFRDYPWNAHNAVYDMHVGPRSRYVESWRFLMLIELAKLVVGRDQSLPTTPEAAEAAAALRRFVTDNWGTLEFDHREVFKAESYRVKTTIRPSVAGTSLGGLEWDRVSRERLGDVLLQMNEWLREAIDQVLETANEYFLVFDELDIDFDPDDPSYEHSVVGLLSAARAWSGWAERIGGSAHVVILLRDDIYEAVHFQDKNKISQALVQTISWTSRTGGTNALKRVLEARIRALLPDVDERVGAWQSVFADDAIDSSSLFSHIVARGFLRPRDLVVFCNLALEAAQNAGALRIGMRHVEAAEAAYAHYLVRELDDEIRSHFAGWRNWLELLGGLQSAEFTREALRERCAQHEWLTDGHDHVEILGQLYRFGIVGQQLTASDRPYTAWAFHEPRVAFDPSASRFHIHPGLYLALPGFRSVPKEFELAAGGVNESVQRPRAAADRPGAEPGPEASDQHAIRQLTPKEKSVLRLMIRGGTTMHISRALGLDGGETARIVHRLQPLATRLRARPRMAQAWLM